MIHILDNAISDPVRYRLDALELEFKSYDFGHCIFHGIAIPEAHQLQDCMASLFPHLKPTLTFFRKSPEGQVEPHFIHTDVDMGEWSAILYMNPMPPPCDGTQFWTHIESKEIENANPHERSEEGRTPAKWLRRFLAPAVFNRLVVFPSSYYHSRALFENWSNSEDARLTQVMFGTGKILGGAQ